MTKLIFASTNENKFNEIFYHLKTYKLEIEFVKFETLEIQSNRLEEVVLEKSKDAFEEIGKPLIVEDTGLFIDSLKGFPGPYSSYVFKTIGNQGILDLLLKRSNKFAIFKSIIAYSDSNTSMIFSGEIKGKISTCITNGGWGYDSIFIPEGFSITYGELGMENKIEISHRTLALDKFAKWFCGGHSIQ